MGGQLAKRLLAVQVFLTLSAWVSGLIILNAWWIVDIIILPKRPLLAIACFAFKIGLLLVPLRVDPPSLVKRFLRFSLVAGKKLWQWLGWHPVAFCSYAVDGLPAGLKHTRILASSAAFWAPVMRHMWWWLGIRPVSRKCFATLLAKGRSVALCPGGIKEVLYMERGREVAYLRKRYGFVRMALQAGAPLVPVFAFGQSDMYSYCRLFYDFPKHLIPRAQWARLARRIGYVPMIIWGWCFSFMPKQVPLYIVVGKPIPVPKVEQPSAEQVEDYLQRFIAEEERIFRQHREAAGQAGVELTVY
ncbi:hypothetical protein COHA_006159 [Chlorella ohadii]|uniref:Acyltransferase n=1 Tax=Chlorella ohadii TaxID=2649997 RepID=A0AAD5DPG3_9CHLO|nr:hypothetical protein COHA_006159 [Chlorella ohadii]